jgi:hypothetical protein
MGWGYHFPGCRCMVGNAAAFERIHKVLKNELGLELSGGFMDLVFVTAHVVTRCFFSPFSILDKLVQSLMGPYIPWYSLIELF